MIEEKVRELIRMQSMLVYIFVATRIFINICSFFFVYVPLKFASENCFAYPLVLIFLVKVIPFPSFFRSLLEKKERMIHTSL